MFYRELKEGEVIQERDLQVLNETIGPVWKRYVGEKYRVSEMQKQFLRPVKVLSFEDVKNTLEICNGEKYISKAVYKTIINLMGLEQADGK